MSLFKRKDIKFDGQKEVQYKIKNQTENIITRRFNIMIGIIIALGALLVGKLYMTQISQHDYYLTKLTKYNTNYFIHDTFRGNIYDRNYKRLVYNKNINCVTYYAVEGISKDTIDMIVRFLIKNVNIDVENVTLRDRKDYMIMKDKNLVNTLLSSEDLSGSSDDIYKKQLKAMDEEFLKKHLTDDDIRYYMLQYKIKNCTNGSIVLLEGLSVKEASIVGENKDVLKGIQVTQNWSREYTYDTSFKSVLGRVVTKKEGLPKSNRDYLLSCDYYNDSRVGISGIEQQYENILKGDSGKYSLTYDSYGNPVVKSVSAGSKGDNIRLTIDWDIQQFVDEQITKYLTENHSADNVNNDHIFVVTMNPNNGDIISMSGKQRLESGEIIDYASGTYMNAYAIGSAFKGGTIYSGYKHNFITPDTIFMDTAAGIKIKGTPVKHSWNKSGLGPLTDVKALSLSSNIYMYYIAFKLGNANYQYDQPLIIDEQAFDTLRKDVGELGLGVKTGIDVPYEALGVRGKITSRLPGHLLDFSIGQYDTYTTVQMAQYISTIANGGKRIQPHLFLDSFNEDNDGNRISILTHKTKVLDDVSEYELAFKQIQKGFRVGVVSGLAGAVDGHYNPAGKTGTAQVYVKQNYTDFVNKTFVGYAPYDNPQITVSCISEEQGVNASAACSIISKATFEKYFEKYSLDKN